MTMFAGVYRVVDGETVDPFVRQQLRDAISRDPRNEVREFSWRSAYLVHVDVGAFGYSSVAETETGAVFAVAGQILSDHRPIKDRHHEVRQFGDRILRGERDAFSAARGTFCAVVYDRTAHSLVLAVDHLGVRPLYWWSDGSTVVFSTTLRLIENLAERLRLRVDTTAVAETCAFGFPLGTATALCDTRCLSPAQTVVFRRGLVETYQWFRWDRVPERRTTDDPGLVTLRETFLDAVRLRLGDDRATQAFLSGGLDSRSVVTALAATRATIYTYNFSWAGSYDQVLGLAYARAIGAIHRESPLPTHLGGEAWPGLVAKALEAHVAIAGKEPERPRVVWSGDGGSVGLGRVYLTNEMVNLMRQGRRLDAIEVFLRHLSATVPKAFLQPLFRSRLTAAPAAGVARELALIRCEDPAKDLLVFLLENDQRRHLAAYYEDIDLTRVEYLLPFFDPAVLTTAVSLPLDDTLYHRVYHRWLQLLPGPAAAVPWQAYPGHEGCPLPSPHGFADQWSREARRQPWHTALRETERRLRQVLSRKFPTPLFSRARSLMAAVLGLMGPARHAYAFRSLELFGKYYTLCRGRLG